ncbi:Transposable element Tcb2 transposase-like 5 [Homarus americanus]|uniref:Transposable element Tcb2 transposase-like 5 n=1 Tax=Homarus americanus TaxID=6706 RepID=A0A8J5JKY1_HOMAM|nr:Transposable element Tcb2 transposase-like 5 [Homarus americanus]
MFGWMHAGSVGQLADVGPGRFTGQKFVEELGDVLLPSVEALFFQQGEPFYLVQDNSPIYTCHAVREWFGRHPYITLLPHPPRSPDLNPIEHVWSAMNKYNIPSAGRHLIRECPHPCLGGMGAATRS